jgi:type II secretory pathway pseudopilin PulG
LIEIIIAISILTITSVFVISSFNKNLNKQLLQEEISIFSDFLYDFENKV